MTPINELDFKFENTPNDYHLRKIMGILHRDDLIVLCRDSQEFSNGLIVVRPDAVIWERGTHNFTVVEFKSRFLQGDHYTLYEYFQCIIEAYVIECVLSVKHEIKVQPLLLYGNGRRVNLGVGDENIITMHEAIAEMNEPYPVPGSKIAAHIVQQAPNDHRVTPCDPDARERGILMHEWLLNPQGK